MVEAFHIHNREALAQKVVEVAKSCADGYRRNISQFNTAGENETAERCACAASNTGFFILQALGFSNDDIQRYAKEQSPIQEGKE